jgi:hypothetical protein
MISRDYRFIFVHIPKCAGTSVRQVLRPYVDITGFQSEYKRMRKGFLFKQREYFQTLIEQRDFHERYIRKQTREDYFMFVFTRHPYDRTVSLWKYLHPDLSFPEFLTWLQDSGAKSYHDRAHIKPCSFYVDFYRRMFADNFIGKTENISEDFRYVCERIGIGDLHLPVLNTSDHDDYTKYYDAHAKAVVRSLYARDFETLDYAD